MHTGSNPYSGIKVFGHPERLMKAQRGERTAPVYVRIKPTNRCNQNCYYCRYKNPYLAQDQYSPDDEIPHSKILEIIRDFKEIGVKAVTFSGGGEPLLYPHIEDAMQEVYNSGIDLAIITNGALLNGKKADLLSHAKWVRISLESGTRETYAKIRGIRPESFEVLCDNIRHFARIKDAECELGVNYVVGPENHQEVYQAGKLLKALGVNHIKYTALISSHVDNMHAPFKEDVIRQIHKLSDEEASPGFKVINMYESDFKQRSVFGRNYDFCAVKDFVTVIAANSKIYYCQDKAYLSGGELGDISKKSFKEVWFSDEVTEKMSKFNPREECRHHCVYDDRNSLLNAFYGLDKNHINFI